MYNIYSVNMNTKNEKETKENNLSAFQKEWPPDRKEQESFLRSLFLICPPPPLPPALFQIPVRVVGESQVENQQIKKRNNCLETDEHPPENKYDVGRDGGQVDPL